MRDQYAQQIRGMSAFDAFLYRGDDDPHTRAIFAVAAILDRTPGRRRFTETFDRATRLVPRLRQRVVAPTLPLVLPSWVVDPEFDLGYHLRFGQLPAPGSAVELVDAAQSEVTAPLDDDRPLWEAVLLEGLEDGHAAVIVRMCHAATDGIGALQLFRALLDTRRFPGTRPMPPLPVAGQITPEDLLVRSLTDLPANALGMSIRVVRELASAASNLDAFRSALAGTMELVGSAARLLGSRVQPSPLLAGRSLRRRCATLEVDLAGLRQTGDAAGVSIDDAYLGCITAALRHYHEALGEPIDSLPMALPVHRRATGEEAPEDRFGAILVAAPLGVTDPSNRLKMIGRAIREGRGEPALDAIGMIAPLLARLPASTLRLLAASTPRPDILASSVASARKPGCFAGAKILKSYAFGPAPGVAAMFTMQSVAGSCCIGVNYDPAAITRSDLFATCLARGFRETLQLGGAGARVGKVAVGRAGDQEMAA